VVAEMKAHYSARGQHRAVLHAAIREAAVAEAEASGLNNDDRRETPYSLAHRR
jgi:hypothetical protein